MNAGHAYARLRQLGVPALRTSDAAAALGESAFAASKTLGRLAKAGLVARLRSGLFTLEPRLDPASLVEPLTAPFPSYVSLQSALYQHGMVEQIPAVTYVVSLGRGSRIRTSIGAFSIHRVVPELFGGFVETGHAKLALPEKALFDLAYLSSGRSRLFAGVPELELPARFRRAELRRWTARIASARIRTRVETRLEGWLKAARD